jgi:hypothetical protein
MNLLGSLSLAVCLLALAGQAGVTAEESPGPVPLAGDSVQHDMAEVEMVTVLDDPEWEEGFLVRDDRAVNALTAQTVRKNAILFVIMHRARQSFAEEGRGDFLGLDAGGLKVGLGLRYGILDNADLGVLRLNGTAEVFDTYELDARYRVLDRRRHLLDLALRAGLSWFAHPGAGDASGVFAQLLGGQKFGRRLTAGAGLLYHADSSGDRKSTDDDDGSLALQGSLEVRLTGKVACVVEVGANVTGYGEDKPVTSASVKAFTHGHTFSLVVSNTQYVGADGIVANAWRDWDEPIIGFNITRELEL